MLSRLYPWSLVFVGIVMSGCWSAGVHRTARTLEPGQSDIQFTANVTRVTTAKIKAAVTTEAVPMSAEIAPTRSGGDILSIPNVIPEVAFHSGVKHNLELGGRVALGSMMLELDVKYRFVGDLDSKLHVAVAPAVGYRTFVLIEGFHATLPLIATYELNNTIALNGAVYGTYLDLSVTGKDKDGLGALEGKFITTGVAGGIRISTDDFYFMPGLDYQQSVYQADVANVEVISKAKFLVLTLTFGFPLGVNTRQLKKMDEKLDRIEARQLQATPAPVVTPAPEPTPPVPAPEAPPSAPQARL